MPEQSSSPKQGSRALYFRVLGYARPYWKMLVAGLLFSALAALMEPLLPALLKILIDSGFAPPTTAPVGGSMMRESPWIVPVVIVGLMVVRGLVTFCAAYAMTRVRNYLVHDVRQQMFDHLVRLPASFFEKNASAHVVTRLTNDVQSIGHAVTLAGVTILRETLTIVALLGYLIYLNPWLTLITVATAPVIAWVTRYIGTRLRVMSRLTQTGLRSMTQALLESILCQKVLKVFGGEQQESRRFARVNKDMLGYAMRSSTASALGSPLVHICVSVSIAIVVYIAMLQAARGEATVGDFVAFILGMLMLLAPLRNLAGVNLSMQQGLAAAESVFELLDMPVEQDSGTHAVARVQGRIEFRNIGFAYEGSQKPVLQDVSFSILPGQTVALVGASGSGKSTLASLLPRFHAPTEGEILLDGVNVRDFSLKSLRAQIAIVSQETLLFDDSIAANIAYGATASASSESIAAAAEAANAMEFIKMLPDRFDTSIGENGNRLSGGQRQRVAIARALLKNSPVLILDEATSALDTESERLVQLALDRLIQDRTTLVIAHRLSTIEKADQIVVLDQGRIVETGTHQALLARDGHYARLYRARELTQ